MNALEEELVKVTQPFLDDAAKYSPTQKVRVRACIPKLSPPPVVAVTLCKEPSLSRTNDDQYYDVWFRIEVRPEPAQHALIPTTWLQVWVFDHIDKY